MPEILSLKESNCKDCYKCIRTCSVKAIRFSQSRAEIIPDECILCGSCFVVCPQKAKQVRSDVELVRKAVSSGRRVVCSLAPSFIAEFPVSSLDDMKEALSRLGIADTEETAVGAQMVSDRYAEIMRQKKTSVLISSCCPTINLLIQKYYPDMLPYLAKVLTPMEAHCKLLKEKDPSCFTVFIGPCIAKKDEADHSSYTDAALTYDELRAWLQSANVEIKMNELTPQSGKRARFYPATGGVLKATDKIEGYRRVAIDGVDNCRAVFEELKSGALKNVFIEMNACEGGCINGPSIREHRERRLRGALRVDSFAGDERFEIEKEPQSLSHDFAFMGTGRVSVGSSAVQEMLRKMGKTSPEKELNCGCCGYPTCRDKAVAILQGKAQLEMCLPFLKEKAESFSDEILRNTPNAVIVMDENLTVQQINRAAIKLLNLTGENDVLHENIIRVLNPEPYQTAITEMRNIVGRSRYLAEYGRYIEETVIYDVQYHVVIAILRDVTERESLRGRDEALRQRTVETADRVIDKQMRVVQEIASLLGETTAETKLALSKLKDAMSHE
ncbi:MAG: [Fe-Fe] hydrogenase large subunit C-terminal domain-containing protein [Eubacteriales bacterium]|nr:[Fe-Fe] hydrogenase large subunit C-terminal domain-containing protein [Eubacteriales bacterium]MDD3880693.1 [Fe-Fe] hydrogenase large subunit C-terminal domain-containing protein [Eubacteriales bacterium]MDD4511673.1 [Fe-Fe] hydrogenase large subunit C-terminal domain-containing protein [Eubacteriales bacterium]